MRKAAQRVLAGMAIAGALITAGTATASAADKVTLGGGSGILLGSGSDEFACTLTAIGYDGAGDLVGITAGHCDGVGAPVSSEAQENAGVVGTVVTSSEYLDYGVIKFDRNRVNPIASVGGTTIYGIGGDAQFGQTACKNGRTTGVDCGVTWGADGEPGQVLNQTCAKPGDSGAPVIVNGQLVGILNGYLIGYRGVDIPLPACSVPGNPIHTPTVTTSINSVLADINVHGGPGAGFVPIAA